MGTPIIFVIIGGVIIFVIGILIGTVEKRNLERKQDYLEQQAQIQENLHEFTNRKRALEKSNINIVKNNRDKVHKNALEKSNINLIKDIGKEPGE